MSQDLYNNVEKLNPPPFVTTLITSAKTRREIFKAWSTLRRKSTVGELSSILRSETELLAGFITRKGTQLRLEKALMLSNRIHKLGKRWLANKWLHEYTAFDDGVQLSLQEKKVPSSKAQESEIRLPSRQWANWITYLTLRDCLILAKIKFECERTTKYWLGLISSSHHAADSLVAVGILSRIWYVSSSTVESLINVIYPRIYKLSIHLEPTQAKNWLTDLEIPSPNDLSSWLEGILGSPFVPARLSKGIDSIARGGLTQRETEFILETDSKSISRTKHQTTEAKSSSESLQPTLSSVSVASTTTIPQVRDSSSDEEDVGVLVSEEHSPPSTSQQLSKHLKKKSSSVAKAVTLDEKWTRFFSGYKCKLKTDKGRKQFGVRIRKCLVEETHKKVIIKLKRLKKLIKSGDYAEMIVMINQFQKFLSKEISS